MFDQSHQKVRADHLKRDAYLYVRQSTLKQVMENTESTDRQYALRRRAVAMGWVEEDVVVIDSDLGQSGTSAEDREGFKRLVADVGMGRAGIVMGLEVSRLARNNADWHRLLEICALSDTLILDEDGVYDPAHFNDRLVLGLKGTMSEAEIHVLQARLRGGIRNKASRGEFHCRLPVGLVYDDTGQVTLHPDKQVRESIALFFRSFHRIGSASATVRYFREQGLHIPRQLRSGPRKGEIVMGDICLSDARRMLHNPRYAGAYVFGRTRYRRRADGGYYIEKLPQDEWFTFIPDAHPGYITWQEYKENLQRLNENAGARGKDRRKSPPREGPALLQGLVVCGVCGRRMTVRYHSRFGTVVPEYVCQKDRIERSQPLCQNIQGKSIDDAIGRLLVETITPAALDVSLAVQTELQSRLDEADALRRRQVERARYDADLARARYMRVDPNNRLVADQLEADWNNKLRALSAAQEEYEQKRREDESQLNEEQRTRILALATDFPRLWKDPKTPQRERKRMVRLLLEDVTLIKGEHITAHIRFKGGATQTITLPLPLPAALLNQTEKRTVAEINRLLDRHTEGEIAGILNTRGVKSGTGKPFNRTIIQNIRRGYDLKPRYERLREKGLLTQEEIAAKLAVAPVTVRIWRDHGLLKAHAYNDKNECLYEDPGSDPPVKMQGQKGKLSERRLQAAFLSEAPCEVQYET